jgi:hypothetical protein
MWGGHPVPTKPRPINSIRIATPRWAEAAHPTKIRNFSPTPRCPKGHNHDHTLFHRSLGKTFFARGSTCHLIHCQRRRQSLSAKRHAQSCADKRRQTLIPPRLTSPPTRKFRQAHQRSPTACAALKAAHTPSQHQPCLAPTLLPPAKPITPDRCGASSTSARSPALAKVSRAPKTTLRNT